jgi:CubicO group peptidase (beta-lactamase class C family)
VTTTSIDGACDARFEPVRRAFAENFATRDEIGAAVAVTLHNQPVVDLWGGSADLEKTRPWQRDTIVNVYSTTKAMTAICALRLVDQGKLDLDAPVARYWPEFAQAGKADLPVRWLLSHRSGLAAIAREMPPEALYEWDTLAAALAEQAPWWTPGEHHGYHAVTFGWLVGEVVRRITGKSLGTFFREEVAEPLGVDFHIGLLDELHGRVADMSALPLDAPVEDGSVNLAAVILADPASVTARAFINPWSLLLGPNTAEWRRAEIPGANGHGNARALARIYGALASGGVVDGHRLLSPAAIESAATEQSFGPDLVLQVSTRFGLGFMLPQPEQTDMRFGTAPGAFGHPGAGGSFAFADPASGIGFAYVMNRMGPHILLDPRAIALLEAAQACA